MRYRQAASDTARGYSAEKEGKAIPKPGKPRPVEPADTVSHPQLPESDVKPDELAGEAYGYTGLQGTDAPGLKPRVKNGKRRRGA